MFVICFKFFDDDTMFIMSQKTQKITDFENSMNIFITAMSVSILRFIGWHSVK